MIEVVLNGGLGNQLFQYSFGRRLAIDRGVCLAIDVSSFKRQSLRGFELDFLKSPDVVVKDRSRLFARFFRGREFKEASFSFDPEALNVSSNSRLIGYWQSYRYFDSIKSQIQKDLERYKHGDQFDFWRRQITSLSNSVAVHVRRGDYVSNPQASEFHGVLGEEYYQEALRILSKVNEDLNIFVFTDDPVWVENSFFAKWNPTIVKGCNAIEDLLLISKCQHRVIANSSFSWWGAYLDSETEGGTTIAPRNWFNKTAVVEEDLFPEGWQLL